LKDPGKKVNVVFFGRFNESEILSGPEKTAKRIFEKYSQNSPGIFVQYFFNGKIHSVWQKLFGRKTKIINDNAVVYTLGLFRVYTFLLKHKPDIVHLITFERFAVIVYLYKIFNSMRLLYNSHGVIAYENNTIKKVSSWYKFKDKFAEKIFMKYSDKIIFPSEQALDKAEEFYTISKKNVIILPNGIDSEFSEIIAPGKISSPLKCVLMCINEFGINGMKFFSKWVSEKEYDCLFYIICSISIDQAPFTKGVHFTKPMGKSELLQFYSDKDIFLQLNDYETFSIATAEAMASGLIPVITKNTGLSRYIDSGFNGYIVEYGNTDVLESVMNSILSAHEAKRKELSDNAREIYKDLNWDSVYDMYRKVYGELKR
jgi:glycosyltransferase involved in cell wall biosynthesis